MNRTINAAAQRFDRKNSPEKRALKGYGSVHRDKDRVFAGAPENPANMIASPRRYFYDLTGVQSFIKLQNQFDLPEKI